MARYESFSERDSKNRSSPAERVARTEIESRLAHRINDPEWTKQCNRLVEFILMLARWDSEQREGGVPSERERKLVVVDGRNMEWQIRQKTNGPYVD